MSLNTTRGFERGIFTLSLDFELAWGSRDLVDNHVLIAQAKVTREAVFEPLLAMLTRHGMVATWATVGHLFLAEGDGRLAGWVGPNHAWKPDWLAGVPAGTEETQPAFYGRRLVTALRDAGQEIGSHSFTHPVFGDPGCSAATADAELSLAVAEAQKLGVSLRSFVFPRNVQGHFPSLVKHGFTCWRGPEPVWYRHGRVPGPLSRLAHLGDTVIAGTPPAVLPHRDQHGLVCIPASASILPVDGPRRHIPVSRRTSRCLRGLSRAVATRRVCHLWFHPINFAGDPKGLLGLMQDVLDTAARHRDRGELDVLPMAALAQRWTTTVEQPGA